MNNSNTNDGYILEAGDFFVISDDPQTVENPIGIKINILSDFDGTVFEALSVCVDHVAAKIIERGQTDEKDMVISLNWKRHRISPVTEEYANAIKNSRAIPNFHGMDDFDPEMFERENDDEHRNTGP